MRVIFKDWITVEDTLPLTRYQNINLRKSENILNRSQSLMHITLGKTQTGDSSDMTSTLLKCTSCTKMKDKRKVMKK